MTLRSLIGRRASEPAGAAEHLSVQANASAGDRLCSRWALSPYAISATAIAALGRDHRMIQPPPWSTTTRG